MPDPVKRQVAYCKRKKGVLVKAMELSILGGKEVAVYILDKKQNQISCYNSGTDFEIDTISSYIKDQQSHQYLGFEIYCNEDYEKIKDSKMNTNWSGVEISYQNNSLNSVIAKKLSLAKTNFIMDSS